MSRNTFDADILTLDDWTAASRIVGGGLRLLTPDLIIAPKGSPYLYRWHLIPRRSVGANVYFHIQVQSDPERPLHDHPWDNTSVILSGGYKEVICAGPPNGPVLTMERRKGDTIFRKAEAAHRLILPDEIPYTMTLFSTGPVLRPWGFWRGAHWIPEDQFVEERDGVSREKTDV